MGWVIAAGIDGELPMTIWTARASPAARVMPRTTAVRTPVRADGMSTWRIVCQRVVPRASDPVRSSCGTARKASYETLVIVGTIMIDRTSEPASQEKPVRKPGTVKMVPTNGRPREISALKVEARNGTRIVMPSQPHTTLGIPTKISRAGWTIDLAHLGATSERKSARPTDTGVEIRSATAVT